jgi:hypothetical protein
MRARISKGEHFSIAPNDRNLSNAHPADRQLPFAQRRRTHQFSELGHEKPAAPVQHERVNA